MVVLYFSEFNFESYIAIIRLEITSQKNLSSVVLHSFYPIRFLSLLAPANLIIFSAKQQDFSMAKYAPFFTV
jgi:hypothetical protein